MIADAHFHIFPPMKGASGHRSGKEHMRYLQRELAFHHIPVRKVEDAAIVDEQMLLPGTDYSLEGLEDVNFRAGIYGRLMWTSGGVDYYKQYLPPLLLDLGASPEMMVAQMNHAGVEKAVIHNGHLYGKLNQYISQAVSRFPSRFWGLALVDEWRAHHRSQIQVLNYAIDTQGLHRLWFDTRNIALHKRRETVDHRIFQPFWDHVKERKIPVFWNCPPAEPNRASYLFSIRALAAALLRCALRFYQRLPLRLLQRKKGGQISPGTVGCPLGPKPYGGGHFSDLRGRALGLPLPGVLAHHPPDLRAAGTREAGLGQRHAQRRTVLYIQAIAGIHELL